MVEFFLKQNDLDFSISGVSRFMECHGKVSIAILSSLFAVAVGVLSECAAGGL